MGYLEALFLGFIQGLTEFLPVSSSGHLTVLPAVLKLHQPSLAFDVALHLATLIAVVVYFREDLKHLFASIAGKGEQSASWRRLVGLLVVGTLPAVVVALVLKDKLEALFSAPEAAAGALLVCGLWLLAASWAKQGRKKAEDLSWWDALVIGIAQSVAMVPGISRSGSTIATGLLTGMSVEEAPRFSFLLMIVAVSGAVVLEAKDAITSGGAGLVLGPTLAGMAAAAIAGYASISVVMQFVKKGRLAVFGGYCLVAGSVFLAWLKLM